MREWRRAAGARLSRLSPPLLVAFVSALLAVGLLQWRHADSRQHVQRSVGTIDGMLQARLRVTRAYLIARNARGGDQTFSPLDAAAELELASLAVSDWLSERHLPPRLLGHARRDPQLRALVEEYGRGIGDFRTRLLDEQASDVEVRSAFARLEGQADAVGRRVSAVLAAMARREEREHALTVFLLTFFILTTGFAFHGVSRRRAQARRALRESDARLRLLMRQLPALTWTTDRELRIVSLGGALLARLPGAVDRLLGRELGELLAARDDRERVLAAHRDALEGRPGGYDIRVDGRFLDVRLEPLRDEGTRIVGVVAVGLDLTERNALEADLRQAQTMEAIGRLAGGVAHDFNNVLNVMLLNAQLLSESLEPGDERQEEVRGILDAGARGTRLIRQLLVVGRQQPQSRTVLDLARLVEDMTPMLRQLVGDGVTLEVQAPREGALVAADLSQVEQILLNLAANARDAMREGGVLTVVVRRAPREPARADVVQLVVADTGAGMDELTRARIFDPFFTTKSETQGTGLGLATVYGIVKQSGGTIQVESAPGRGATFTVALPAASDAASPAA